MDVIVDVAKSMVARVIAVEHDAVFARWARDGIVRIGIVWVEVEDNQTVAATESQHFVALVLANHFGKVL